MTTPCNCLYHTAYRVLVSEGEFPNTVGGTHFWLNSKMISAKEILLGVR